MAATSWMPSDSRTLRTMAHVALETYGYIPGPYASLLSIRKPESGLQRSIHYPRVFTRHLSDTKLSTFRKEAHKS